MSGPLNFKAHTTNGGSYGTNSTGSASGSSSNNNNNNSNTTTRRQRRNPSDYGPFSSPHGSVDDHNNPTASFPPYAELPFTSLKRRRQLQDNNSFVKWAMRAVLLSPVVVLVLWSVAAVMFATTHTHQVAQTQQQRNGNSNTNSSNKSNVRQQSQRRGIRRMFGNGSNNNNNNNNYVQPNVVYSMQSDNTDLQQLQQQQFQDNQGNLIYNVNGNTMMMVPQQQQQLQGIPLAGSTLNVIGGQQSMPAAGQFVTATGNYQQQAVPLQPQGQQIPVFPLGSTSNQQQILQPVQVPAPQQAAAAAAYTAVQPQQVLTAQQQQQQQQIPIASLDNTVVAAATDYAIQTAMQQPMTTSTAGLTDNNNSNNVVMQQQPQQQLQMSSDSTTTGTSSVAGEIIQDQLLQGSPSKQAVYFYDPKDTTMSQTGDILQLPTLVYDAYGNAIPLTELHQQAAPIYVQPPILGSGSSSSSGTGAGAAASTSTTASDYINVVKAAVINPPELLLSKSAPLLGATNGSESAVVGVASSNPDLVLLSESTPLGASIMPQAWGSSTSQDQTIIIATVAVMALLVGALSARRLRSKSFLSSCIENETLEDDVAYDDAYTTTAAASGAVGADSSYNTFGGWKGDLEKFDV
ncbi:hypothetical protein FRACYDRAFT_237862 [Fragilariopsis cylindrus CCMP1102]|uniref:Uncharacterized protein n=1 Tax=Fragilariopsis cylindrus CCMP1102 TaxID=635003 RepID=A0A1E7FH41_9STRA|nr:hypothetical protein FRACYDRAFT_237862 [Fragilariopsis cylindrus CCMP1102]|eukprot:OEU17444.1 hypothetical protein FRACYDRAFT_237862 [Fragilariopsis cylindrus CCMP1102]